MSNPNVPSTNLENPDFAAWETELQPYGADMLIETDMNSLDTDPNRALACSSVADAMILEIPLEDLAALR
jgi:hypothetical protein